MDTVNPLLYDLIINIKKLTTDNAVDIIESMLTLDTFQTTPESQQFVEDLCLAAAESYLLLRSITA